MKRFLSSLFLLYAVSASILSANEHKLNFRQLNMSNSNLSHNFTTSIIKDTLGFVWIGTTNGLNRLDGQNITTLYSGDRMLPSSIIQDLCLDKHKQMLVKTPEGVYRYDYQSDSFVEGDKRVFIERDSLLNFRRGYIKNMKLDIDLSGIFIRNVSVDNQGQFWIASNTGIYICNVKTGNVSRLYHQPEAPFSLSDSRVSSIFHSDNGEVWVTTDSGVNYTDSFCDMFHKYTHFGKTPLQNSNINGFAYDNAGQLYISTENAGVYTYDIGTENIGRFSHPALPDIILGIDIIDGHIWIKLQRGMLRINMKTLVAKRFTADANGTSLSQCRHIYKGKIGGNTYLGTKNGLYQFLPEKDCFKAIKEFNELFIESIYEDSKGHLWISTYSDGIIEYNPAENVYNKYIHDNIINGSLPCNRILDVFEDSRSDLWICTFGSGICKLERDNNTFTVFNSKTLGNSAINDMTYSICEDSYGYFWINTYKGLVRFDPESRHTICYTTAQGLLDNEFVKFSSFILPDNRIFLGSQNGMVVFNAHEIISAQKTSKIIITDLFINNERITGRIENTINLKHDENTFGFGLAAINTHYTGNSIECRLDGYSNLWQKVHSDNTITFVNVPPGEYTLKIRDGIKSEHSNIQPQVAIRINPPWYNSPASRAIYVLFGLSLLSVMIFFIIAVVKRREKRIAAIRQREEEMELLEERAQFLSNIVQEIKVPLKQINSSLGEDSDLEVINRTTTYLTSLANELLDKRNLIQKIMHESISLCNDEDLSISKQDKDFLKKMNEAIEANIADPGFSIERLEAAASMSSSTLLRKFKKLLNTTPNNYIRTKRLILAAQMIEDGNDRASDICWSCGFNSTSYFTKCFREYYGMTPQEYIQKTK